MINTKVEPLKLAISDSILMPEAIKKTINAVITAIEYSGDKDLQSSINITKIRESYAELEGLKNPMYAGTVMMAKSVADYLSKLLGWDCISGVSVKISGKNVALVSISDEGLAEYVVYLIGSNSIRGGGSSVEDCKYIAACQLDEYAEKQEKLKHHTFNRGDDKSCDDKTFATSHQLQSQLKNDQYTSRPVRREYVDPYDKRS